VPRRRTRPRGACYLVCTRLPFKHFRHYLGYAYPAPWHEVTAAYAAELAAADGGEALLPAEAAGVARRVAEHRAGTGANVLGFVVAAGIVFDITRVWAGTTERHEKYLKDLKAHTLLCPRCTPGTGRGRALKTKARRRPRRRSLAVAA
jgi:hypothetical protein